MLLEELELLVPRDPQADQATLLIERGVLELLGDALERLVDGIVRVGDEQHPTSRLEVGLDRASDRRRLTGAGRAPDQTERRAKGRIDRPYLGRVWQILGGGVKRHGGRRRRGGFPKPEDNVTQLEPGRFATVRQLL